MVKPEGKAFKFVPSERKYQAILDDGTGAATSPYQTKLIGDFKVACRGVIANITDKKLAAKYLKFDIYVK